MTLCRSFGLHIYNLNHCHNFWMYMHVIKKWIEKIWKKYKKYIMIFVMLTIIQFIDKFKGEWVQHP